MFYQPNWTIENHHMSKKCRENCELLILYRFDLLFLSWPDLKWPGRLSITAGSVSAKGPTLSITDMMQTRGCHSPAGGTALGSFRRQNGSKAKDWKPRISGDWKMCVALPDKYIATQLIGHLHESFSGNSHHRVFGGPRVYLRMTKWCRG